MSTKQTLTRTQKPDFLPHRRCVPDSLCRSGSLTDTILTRFSSIFIPALLAILAFLPFDLMSNNPNLTLGNVPEVFNVVDDNPPFSMVNYQIIPAGSFIINMGVQPQTVNNALKPYGLIWDLLENHQVPIIWAINPGKAKDGVDFTYNGTDFKGGPFIISAEYRTAAVNAKIVSWQSLGVVGVTTTYDITVPVNRVLNYSMRWTLDSQNGSIAEKFLQNAGIPSSGYNWVAPSALTCCNDLFVMPHADPTWSTHSKLLTWNDSEANGGCGGAIWAGCKAVSELENIVNPSNASQRLNFLMKDPIAPATNPAVPANNHNDGNPPYTYGSNYDNPVMQFLGSLDGGQESGAEQVYLPTTGWRPSTYIGVWDPTQSNLGTLSPGPAAKLAFGPAFGNSSRGYINYTSGHDIAKSNNEANIAAQRTFFNFSFMALYDKSIKPVTVVPSATYSGQSYLFSATATGGSGSYSYTWTSSCGGTFSNPNSASSSFTAPIVTTPTTCTIQLVVTDGCANRTSFKPIQITIVPAEHEICNNGIDDDGDGLIDSNDPDCCGSLVALPKTGWALKYVDSQETVGENGAATNAFDGNTNTFWHTKWYNGSDAMPHEIQIDLGASKNIGGFRCLPRQSGVNGRIANFEFSLSQDGINWGTPLVSGLWTYSDYSAKEVQFTVTSARYIRLKAISEAAGNPWTSIAEIDVLNCPNYEICTNGFDDDGDGFVDYADADCFNIGNCGNTPGQNNITGAVFNDANGNQVFNNGENSQSGVTLTLFKDNNSNGAVDAGDTQLDTKVTGSSGKYAFTVNPAFDAIYNDRINAACNDGRNGNNSENKIQFGKDKNIGLRFTGISIPAGATITSAYLYFVSNTNQSNSGSVDVYANKTASPADFCSNSNVNLRTRTTAKTSWAVGSWSNGTEYQSSDVKNVIQELVTTYGAYSNGSIAMIMISTGFNNVEAKSYETNNNSSQAPRLVINYTLNNTEKYVVRLETSTLPPFTQLTTPGTATASFTASGTVDCNNIFGFKSNLEICNNGLDDDGDGKIDCADSDCNLGLTANAGTSVTICASGSTTLTASATGGVSPYTYAWSNSLGSGVSKSVTPVSTTTYTVTVTSANGCTASSQVTVTVVAGPAITAQPASTSICTGGTQTLSVTATGGTPSLAYQWQDSPNGNGGWSNILGATSSSYTTPALAATAYYRVLVSATGSGCGSVTSAVATVTVMSSPTISSQPTGSTICNGGTYGLSVAASGGATYQWQSSTDNVTFANISSATSANYTTPALSATAYYRVIVSVSGCASVTSNAATVTVVPDPAITVQPVGGTICSGSAQTLSVTASGGTPSLGYQWQSSSDNITFTNISGATSSSYTTLALSATRYYRVVVSAAASGCGSVTSSAATVVVNTLSANAGADATVCSGTGSQLSANATGGLAPYAYNWCNGLGSNPTVTVTPVSNTTYTVTVTAANGCTSTDQVVVSVNTSPTSNAGLDVTICNGASTTLSGSSTSPNGQISYAWSNGVTGKNQTVSPTSTTTYTVTVTHTSGCFSTDQVVVTVQNCSELCNNGLDDDFDGLIDCADSDCGPSANAGSDISVCPGTPAFLSVGVTGGSSPYTYAWSNGLGTGATKTVSPLVTTTYSVTVTSASGCTSIDQIKVSVNACSENCTNGVDDDGDGLVDCADPDCSGVTAPVLVNDFYTTCPGMTYSNRVTYNDGNLNNPAFSIAAAPLHGSVTIDWTGKFNYTPNSFECVTDYFTYQVCNQTSGCCQTALVSITMGDNTLPVLTNLPADLTISCDDAVPPASVVTAFDQCPGIYMDFDETSSQNYVGACGSYTITRTWTATDFCGNATTGNQNITVLDQTKPELFQVYTLEGGAKLVAGNAQRVTHDWKYVRFPITFKAAPVVLASIGTNTDVTAVITQMRNVSMQGFELRLREEEALDGKHGIENVSWIAMDATSHNGNLKWEAGTLANVNEVLNTITFSQTYTSAPLFFASSMTNGQSDPATLRRVNLSTTGVEIFAQEEQSADTEVGRINETAGYLVIKDNAPLVDADGNVFGETGRLNITNAWATVSLARKYTKPVVIIGGVSNNDGQPITLRVRGITGAKFEVRLQEWGYLDGNHPAESISWIVVEGSVPGNISYYCGGSADHLKPNINLFAVDNCDDLVAFGDTQSSTQQTTGVINTRTWTAIDDCGNTTLISRNDTCQVAAVRVKALLYGPMLNNGGGNTMRDNLRALNYVPTVEPYSQIPAYPYVQNENAQVTICHHSGLPDQQTMMINSSDLQIHLDHGDVVGECGPLPPPVPTGAAGATYRTIAAGNWMSPATWKNGLVPPTGNILNQTISIEHQVTLQAGNIWLKNGSKMWITNGSLKIVSGYLYLTASSFNALNSSIDVSGSFSTSTGSVELYMKNCEVRTGAEFAHESGMRKLENVCVNTGTDFIKGYNGVLDTLINVTATVNGNFKNWKNGSMYMSNCKFRIVNGSFRNDAGNTINGNGLTVLVENGALINLGVWNTTVEQYCVSGLVTVPTISLPAVMDCANIFNWVASCSMGVNQFNTGGGGSTGGSTGGGGNTGGNTSSGNTGGPIRASEGILNPPILQVTGNEAIVDWLLLELRSYSNEADILGYATVLLKRDGEIVSEKGDSVIVFMGLDEGDYYVSIRHRNHLGLMTNTPVFLTISDPPMVDFTNVNLPIRGGNNAGKTNNGKRTLWGGDFNGDGRIIYQGPYNDVFSLFTRVVGDGNNAMNLANFIVPGYELQDFNLDGKVIYQGPLNDRGAMLFGSILSNPGNTAMLSNYITLDFVP